MGAITARRRHSALPLMTTTIQYNANAAVVTISPNGRFTLFNGPPDYRIVDMCFALPPTAADAARNLRRDTLFSTGTTSLSSTKTTSY
ncbi:hypothetical protein TcasGA2_TC000280 [Tribolium castaneum]|uniref:Uncharacterized protein n=1 Tax=Tribolium castaneum TaxID=7070 RepID=D6WBD6_TRICA|nr:hypothetical protein TcasGA2_TC000280 [Tribolium castaneum]